MAAATLYLPELFQKVLRAAGLDCLLPRKPWDPSRQDRMVDHSNHFSVTFTMLPLLPGLIYSSLGVNQSEPSQEALSPELNEEE